MYVGWLFDSNQNEVTVIADCEFNTSLKRHHTFIFDCIENKIIKNNWGI